MTVIGIMGCTALILVGFGLKNSISNIMDFQYEEIFNYDSMVSLKSSLLEEEKIKLVNEVIEMPNVQEVVEADIVANEAKSNDVDKVIDVQVIIPKSIETIKDAIALKDVKTEEIKKLNDDSVFITKKASELLNVSVRK